MQWINGMRCSVCNAICIMEWIEWAAKKEKQQTIDAEHEMQWNNRMSCNERDRTNSMQRTICKEQSAWSAFNRKRSRESYVSVGVQVLLLYIFFLYNL